MLSPGILFYFLIFITLSGNDISGFNLAQILVWGKETAVIQILIAVTAGIAESFL
jgi:hypothetical protein